MTSSHMTSAMFEHAPDKAKEAANESPMVITDHGRPRMCL
jgi:hypothetical protein